MRKRVFRLLDGTDRADVAGRAVNIFLILLILANVGAVILESVEDFEARHRAFLQAFELFSVIVFTVEYALRLWVCTEDGRRRYGDNFRGRLRYALTPMAVIDFLAIAPFYISMLFVIDLRFLRVFRLLRQLNLDLIEMALPVFVRVKPWIIHAKFPQATDVPLGMPGFAPLPSSCEPPRP